MAVSRQGGTGGVDLVQSDLRSRVQAVKCSSQFAHFSGHTLKLVRGLDPSSETLLLASVICTKRAERRRRPSA